MQNNIYATDAFNNSVFPLHTTEQLSQWPTIEWIVEDVIQCESSVVIFGQSRTGKSFLALDLASKIANGEDWFGHKVIKRRVIYVPAEGIRGVANRIKAIEQANTKPVIDLMFMTGNIDLAKSEDIQKIIDTGFGKADVLIVDTFNAVTPGSDENSSKDMGNILYGIRQIINKCRCTVVLVHHTGWDDKDRMRGHSSLSAAIDTRIHVKQAGGLRQWAVTGQRDGELTGWKRFNLVPIELENDKAVSCIVAPYQDSSIGYQACPASSLTLSENNEIVLKIAAKLFSDKENNPLTLSVLLESVTPLVIAQPKHRSTRAKDSLDWLTKKGLITFDDEGHVNKVMNNP